MTAGLAALGEVIVTGRLPQPIVQYVQPCGAAFFKLQSIRQDVCDKSTEQEEVEVELQDDDIKLDLDYIKGLDAKDWKEQDHYRVLGIPDLRCTASLKMVKKAYKFMVLRCHPDKSLGDTKVDEEAFTCIQKAYEQLCTYEGKRAYDSIDPEFDDDVPNPTEANKQNFYQAFQEVIKANSKWSMKKPVPQLNADDNIDKVNDFYNFWYDFKSWREYSYLDEEERDKADCKEERRYIDKINKTERLRRKKEEMARVQRLVDNCYACDPRIKAFVEERKRKKQELKQARQDAYRKEQEDAKAKKLEEERIAREEEERKAIEAKEKAEQEKKLRQKQNKVLKGERKTMREYVKSCDYCCTDINNMVKAMEDLELLVINLSLEEMQTMNAKYSKEDKNVFANSYKAALSSFAEQQEEKRKESLIKAKQSQEVHKEAAINNDKFSTPDVAILVKAVKIYPPGTINRWATIAQYLNDHSTVCQAYEAKDIISKVKQLQSKEGDELRNKVNKSAFETFESSQKLRVSEVTHTGGLSQRENVNSVLKEAMPAAEAAPAEPAPEKKKKEAWSPEEQKLLEGALKSVPQSPERWDKIAEVVGTRSKKECQKRYKELVALIKAKKAAK